MPKPWKPTEPSRVYRHLRAVFGDPSLRGVDARRRRANGLDPDSVPYGRGREPKGLGDVVGSLTQELGWTEPLARSELFVDWPAVVGEELAKHSRPMTIDDGALVIRCDSTAWATQLRLMRGTITTTIAERHRRRASSRSGFPDRTSPPGNAASGRFRGAALATPTVEPTKSSCGAEFGR
ncbi:DUF721 domain-containing protein [Curtobacterium flaccumfaciens]|nr:DUF721 domain-containing protein [Curtobacterium flaccumfaciens]